MKDKEKIEQYLESYFMDDMFSPPMSGDYYLICNLLEVIYACCYDIKPQNPYVWQFTAEI